MNKNLCTRCKQAEKCYEPFPHDECDDYVRRYTNADIIRLFYGMSKTMQKSILQIMEITQDGKK